MSYHLIAITLLLSLHAHAGMVQTGAARLLAQPQQLLPADCGRLGLLVNPTSILPNMTHIVDALAARNNTQNIQITAVFGPEHGFRGDQQAGSGGPSVTIDPRTGLPVYSLYGLNTSSIAAVLNQSGIDTLIFDIQDVGTRFYTYIWTLYDTMQAMTGTPLRHLLVLDRPNPLGGVTMRGPVLEPAFSSFIGRAPVPQQHGMTAGELAQFFYATALPAQPQYKLQIVTMQGWTRDMRFDATGLPWVMPSPNMPTLDTATVYPGLGILEGTNLSEGRGTTRPFELFGAGYFDWRFAASLAANMAQHAAVLAGAVVRENYFIPTFSKFMGNVTSGVQLYVTDVEQFDAVAWGVYVVATARRVNSTAFAFLSPDGLDFDLHMGTNKTRLQLESGESLETIVASWQPQLQAFGHLRQQYLLY